MSKPSHLLIIDARFYEPIADELVAGAVEAITSSDATFERVSVPGVLEIPAALSFAVAGTGAQYDGYVLLGCVIRGETTHYDVVAEQSARAVMDLAVANRLAVGNGILTVETETQATVRADRGSGNKGGGAARAALAMIALRRHLTAREHEDG